MASSNIALAQEKTTELSVYLKNLERFKVVDKILEKIDGLSLDDLKNVVAYMESLEEFSHQDQDQDHTDEEQEETIWTKDYYNECYNPRKEV